MSDIVNLADLNIGDTISFKTMNAYDTVTWRGKITGFANYDLVRQMEDLLPYYQNVKKNSPDMADIEYLSYIVLDCYENLTTETYTRRIFAKEWLDPSSVKIIDMNKHMDIRIYDISETDIQRIRDILSDSGYSIAVINTDSNS